MDRRNVLISGGGIAGVTLAILLKQHGYKPLVVEREPALPADGYMLDFFGTAWDVAERMGLTDALRAIRYPIDPMEFVDRDGRPHIRIPIERMRRALHYRYVYLRRTDLARVLLDRAQAIGVEVRFGETVEAAEDRGDRVSVRLSGGSTGSFALLFGADGIHSRIRELLFGPEPPFERYLGYHVAAFHIGDHAYDIGRSVKIYEEPDRMVMVYPVSERQLDATLVFRHAKIGHVAHHERLAFLRKTFAGAGWIAERLLT